MNRFSLTLGLAALCLMGASEAAANVDPACDTDGNNETDGFDASLTSPEAQEWNLAMATALSVASSPMNSPAPYKPFKLSVGFDLHQFDAMTCEERTVFFGGAQKTEDTNKTPVIPRLRVTLGLPLAYLSISGLPPVTMFGVRTGLISGELAGGYPIPGSNLKAGVRVHATGGQIIGDIAHPVGLEPGEAGYDDAAVNDEYQFKNYGADVSLGWQGSYDQLTFSPYVGAGLVSVSSIFYIGEDAYTVLIGDGFVDYYHEENPHPEGGAYPGYRGLDAFAGVRVLFQEHFEGVLEGFFIPVRTAIGDERLLTEAGVKSDYVTNYFSLRARLGYIF